MLVLFIVFAALVAVTYRMTTAEERARTIGAVREFTEPMRVEMARGRLAIAPFRTALKARTRWAVVTPTLIGLNVWVFSRMLVGPGSLDEPETLVAWGGSLGRHTLNGEWWRLVTALFVHAGIFHVLASLIGLLKLGFILERLVGPVTFTCVYFAAGVFANLVTVSENQLDVHVGASGAIFGLYGLLLAVTTWGLLRRQGLRIPLMAYQALAPGAAVFVLYNMATGGLGAPSLRGFLVGLVSGLVLTKDIGERKPGTRPMALVFAAAAVGIIYIALPLRGLVDVRPEIAQVVAIEERTAAPYKAAVERLRVGRTNVRVLTEHINVRIMPELQAARARIDTLDGVRLLREHQVLVADAEEYLRLRETSWRLRAEALRNGNSQTMLEADRAERASLQALERLKAKQLTPDVLS